MTNEELVKCIRQGNNELMGELYEHNKPVMQKMAKRLTNSADEYEDAMQDAYFGLVEAVKAYDESKGYKFITYANYHVRVAINRGKSKTQHVPEYLIDRVRKISQAESELLQQLQCTPTKAEIAAKTNLTVESINYTLKVVKAPISVNTPLFEGTTIADTIADESIDFENDVAEASERQYIKRTLHKAVDKLPERHRNIIQMYYFEGMGYKAISEQMGVSFQRVQQIAREAIRKLKNPQLKQQLIDEAVDLNTEYYQHRGLQAFKNTWTSSTESIVFERERIRQEFERRLHEAGAF